MMTKYDLIDQKTKDSLGHSTKMIYMYIRIQTLLNKSTKISYAQFMYDLKVTKPTVVKAIRELKVNKLIKINKIPRTSVISSHCNINQYTLI